MHIKASFPLLLTINLLVGCGCSSMNKQLAGENRYNQSKVVSLLKNIRKAQASYRSVNGSYGSLNDLARLNLVKTGVTNDDYFGYMIEVKNTPDTYKVLALPIKDKSELHSFYLDETGVIRSSFGGAKTPTALDPPIVEQ